MNTSTLASGSVLKVLSLTISLALLSSTSANAQELQGVWTVVKIKPSTSGYTSKFTRLTSKGSEDFDLYTYYHDHGDRIELMDGDSVQTYNDTVKVDYVERARNVSTDFLIFGVDSEASLKNNLVTASGKYVYKFLGGSQSQPRPIFSAPLFKMGSKTIFSVPILKKKSKTTANTPTSANAPEPVNTLRTCPSKTDGTLYVETFKTKTISKSATKIRPFDIFFAYGGSCAEIYDLTDDSDKKAKCIIPENPPDELKEYLAVRYTISSTVGTDHSCLVYEDGDTPGREYYNAAQTLLEIMK